MSNQEMSPADQTAEEVAASQLETDTKMSPAGFLIFTTISVAMALYILAHVISTCRQYKALSLRQRSIQARYPFVRPSQNKQALLNFGGSDADSVTADQTLTLQGLKFKSMFFAALFVICLRKSSMLLLSSPYIKI